MFTIQDVSQGKPEAYNRVKEELEFIFNGKMYGVSSAIHDAISHLWLLPETPEREALREKLYEFSEEFMEILETEYQKFRK